MRKASVEKEKFETSFVRLGSMLTVTDALLTISDMDWQAGISRSSDGRLTLLIHGYPKHKKIRKDANQLSFSENLDNLGEQSWTSPHS